ncbi:probable mannitol dehydrogenase [Eucalyptus grandis]|uniref:probable mannitol dehydrogenase n=1 Tax=Eucalyptus grandis TaxID=71139 RepID=UPI00192ED4D6|nr:probable mannitol dehydrogenase [Eucalyptus grandis]
MDEHGRLTRSGWTTPGCAGAGQALIRSWSLVVDRSSPVSQMDGLGMFHGLVRDGSLIDQSCPQQSPDDLENYYPKMILSYGAKYNDGTTTYGAYSYIMVSNKHFMIKIPDNLPLDGGAPLLCAEITIYSPLKYYGFNKAGMHLGVVWLGGLGHIAVKFTKAMGLKVTVISTSLNKKKEAMNHLGADTFLVSCNTKEMELVMGTMDGIIDTVSAILALLPLINLLKINGKLVMVGAPEKLLELLAFPLLMGKPKQVFCVL